MAPQWSQKNKRRAVAASLLLLALLWITVGGPGLLGREDKAERAVADTMPPDNEFTPPDSAPLGHDPFRPEDGQFAVAGGADTHAARSPASPREATDGESVLVVPRPGGLGPQASSSNGVLPRTAGPGPSAGAATGSPVAGGAASPGAGVGPGAAGAVDLVASASSAAAGGGISGLGPAAAGGTSQADVTAFVPGANAPATGGPGNAPIGDTATVPGLDSATHRDESLDDIAASGGGRGGNGLGAFPPPPGNAVGALPSDGAGSLGGGTPPGQANGNGNVPVNRSGPDTHEQANNQSATVPEPAPFLLLIGPALYFSRRQLSLRWSARRQR